MNDYDLKRVAKAEKALFAKLCAKTNGDIMRAKTDEELAAWFDTVETAGNSGILVGKESWFWWLRQEAEEGE